MNTIPTLRYHEGRLHPTSRSVYDSPTSGLRRNRRHRQRTLRIHRTTQYGGNIRDLIDAASRGDVNRVKTLVENGNIDINHPGTYKGRTALMMAAKRGYIHVVEYLVDHGADVNRTDEEGETPLLMAIMSPHEQHREPIITCLLEHGADVNHADNSGRTPLHLVSFDGTVPQAQMLMDHGADVNRRDIWGKTPLQNAVDAHSIDMIHYLVEHGADVRTIDKEGNTVLHGIDYPLDDATFAYFIEHGADVRAVNRAGKTVLASVVESCRPGKRIALLVERGVDIRSEPVLCMAIRRCADPMVIHVIEQGADVHQADALGNTPLHVAARRDRKAVVDLLLEHGAAVDVDRVNALGDTPLHEAVRKKSRDIVRRLVLEPAVDANRVNAEGKSPLRLAFLHGADAVVIRLLLEGGANARETGPEGETFLHMAAKNDQLAIMKSLVQHGANVLAKDVHGHAANYYVPPKATGTKTYLDRVADRQNAENVLALMSMHGKPDKASTKFYTQAPGMARKVTRYLGGRGRRTKKRR